MSTDIYYHISTPTDFLIFSQNLAHVICVPITVEQIFDSLILIFFGNFFKILNLDLVC